jgi:hypothetical protein
MIRLSSIHFNPESEMRLDIFAPHPPLPHTTYDHRGTPIATGRTSPAPAPRQPPTPPSQSPSRSRACVSPHELSATSSLCRILVLIALSLASKGFNQTVPLELARCSSLTSLNLNAVGFWGPLPNQLALTLIVNRGWPAHEQLDRSRASRIRSHDAAHPIAVGLNGHKRRACVLPQHAHRAITGEDARCVPAQRACHTCSLAAHRVALLGLHPPPPSRRNRRSRPPRTRAGAQRRWP